MMFYILVYREMEERKITMTISYHLKSLVRNMQRIGKVIDDAVLSTLPYQKKTFWYIKILHISFLFHCYTSYSIPHTFRSNIEIVNLNNNKKTE